MIQFVEDGDFSYGNKFDSCFDTILLPGSQ